MQRAEVGLFVAGASLAASLFGGVPCRCRFGQEEGQAFKGSSVDVRNDMLARRRGRENNGSSGTILHVVMR